MPKEKKLLMKLRGQFVDIMCEVNKEYKDYVMFEKGQKNIVYSSFTVNIRLH